MDRLVPTADDFVVFQRGDLPESELQGIQSGAGVSLIFVDLPPGEGPRLHRHPYEEVFIVLEGTPRFTVNGRELHGGPGMVVVVRANADHKFQNAGPGRLRQLDIHVAPSFKTEWLE